MRVIGLTGVAKSGKDTVAEVILHRYTGKRVIRQGFADALKLSAGRLFYPNCTPEIGIDFCNWLKGENIRVQIVEEHEDPHSLVMPEIVSDISGRQFLQRYGTEAHRDVFGKDFWLDAVLPLTPVTFGEGGSKEIDRDDCDVLVIPDVRFENEAKRVLYCGGEIWLVRRPGVAPVEDHASENGVPLGCITKIIANTGTLDDLERVVVREL